MAKPALPNVSIRALSRLTGLNRDYLNIRIADAQPSGTRGGYPVYSLADVLPLLCRPAAANGGPTDPDTLAPVDRRAWFDSEIRRRQLQERDRELIPVDEVERAVGTAFARVAQALLSLPDTLERQAGLTPEQFGVVLAGVHGMMEGLANDLASLGTDAAS